MADKQISKPQKLRKLIDLDREVVKQLQIQAIKNDFSSVKSYMQFILTELAKKNSIELDELQKN